MLILSRAKRMRTMSKLFLLEHRFIQTALTKLRANGLGFMFENKLMDQSVVQGPAFMVSFCPQLSKTNTLIATSHLIGCKNIIHMVLCADRMISKYNN